MTSAQGLLLEGVTIRVANRTLVAIERLACAPGTVTAVTGPSGSGKSSLLAWMTGLLEPPLEAAGTIHVGGIDLTALPTEARRLGLMQQDDVLFPHLSVLENLLFAMPRGAQRRAQRCELALRALAAQPCALLLDEPFSRLHQDLRAELRALVWRLAAAAGVPVLLVTHDPQDVPEGAAQLRLGI